MAGPGVTISDSVVGWLLAAAGTFVLFLMSLVVKDIREKMHKVDQLCVRLSILEQKLSDMEQLK